MADNKRIQYKTPPRGKKKPGAVTAAKPVKKQTDTSKTEEQES